MIPKGKRCDYVSERFLHLQCRKKATMHKSGSSFWFCEKHFEQWEARTAEMKRAYDELYAEIERNLYGGTP
jgi:hypothetical protein